jgi:hypothetical protein
MEWHKVAIAAAFAFVFWALFILPSQGKEPDVVQFAYCQAQNCEKTTQEQILESEEIDARNPMKCMVEALVKAQRWIAENRPNGWVLIHWRCGKPRITM